MLGLRAAGDSGTDHVQRPVAQCLAIAVALLMTGCASSEFMPDLTTGSIAPPPGSSSTYILSEQERALPCAKLNGRIQMRILAVRHASAAIQPSIVSQGMRSAAENVGLWSQKAANLDASLSRDVALVKAYNHRLSELGCPTFDIKADLAKSDTADLPRPRRAK